MPFQSAFAQLFTQNTIIASVVFGCVVLAMAVALVLGWRRRRRGRPASARAEANPLEIGYVSVLAIIVAFLVTTGFMANARDFSDPRPAVTVRVTGYQWCWRFNYEGTPVTVDGQCQSGRPPVLVVPAGQPVQIDVTSTDVVHAFWVPYLRVKMYAYPDHGALLLIWAFATQQGASNGWWGYTPMSTATYSPGPGQSLWIAATFMAACGMILQGATTMWTLLRMRAPGVTMMRIPVFCWAQLVTCLMVVSAFPSLLLAMLLAAVGRIDPGLFATNGWNIAYQNLFWFYGHPVVYVMFFPFVGCVAEALATFTGRRFFGYKGTALSLLAFAAGSMAVWGHHLFASGQEVNDYFSLTSIMLSIPAGVEYFGFLGTLFGGRPRYTTSMLFALAFIPQFLVGGLTGILVANPAIDYHVNNSYFVLGHFHYTLLAGSFFGFLAGFYLWFPKATGTMLSERLGKAHFVLMVIGTNVTFVPFFILGYDGMPRWMATYPAGAGFTTLSLISSIGAGVIGVAMCVFAWNVYTSARRKAPAGPDPWGAQTLEWVTSSPPPRFNFDLAHPVPRVTSYAPLLDRREQSAPRTPGAPAPRTPGAPAPRTPGDA